jgi:hypothetical protein
MYDAYGSLSLPSAALVPESFATGYRLQRSATWQPDSSRQVSTGGVEDVAKANPILVGFANEMARVRNVSMQHVIEGSPLVSWTIDGTLTAKGGLVHITQPSHNVKWYLVIPPGTSAQFPKLPLELISRAPVISDPVNVDCVELIDSNTLAGYPEYRRRFFNYATCNLPRKEFPGSALLVPFRTSLNFR